MHVFWYTNVIYINGTEHNTVIWLVLLLFREWIMKFGSQAKPLVVQIQTDT